MGLTVKFKDPDAFQDFVEAQFDRLEEPDLREVLREYSTELEAWHGTYFEEQHEPAGKKWEELRPATKAKKGHDIILWETGKLRDSLEVPGADDSIREATHEGQYNILVYGTSVPYAHFHMTGTERMVARPFLGVTEEKVDVLGEMVLDYLAELYMAFNIG